MKHHGLLRLASREDVYKRQPFTGLSPERRQALLEGYKLSKKKQKKGCMIGCGIVFILAMAAVIAGAIGGVLKSKENRCV